MMATFVHDDFAAAVSADDDEMRWLEEFLTPAFTRAPHDTAIAADVAITCERGVAGLTNDRLPAPVVYALDSGPVCFPASRTDGGFRVRDPLRPVEFEIDCGRRMARVRHELPTLDARMRLMRVVREYAHNHSLRSGGLVLHAAAVVIDGIAIAIAGSKGSGKTTMALRALETDGVGYLSNDRVLVRRAPAPVATPVPTVVAIREGTRIALPAVAHRLGVVGDLRETARDRAARGPRAPFQHDPRWQLSLAQVAAAMDRRLHASAPLGAIVVLDGDPASARPLTRLDRARAGDALAAATLGHSSGTYVSEVFVATQGRAPTRADLEARAHDVASLVPCFVGAPPAGASSTRVAALLRRCLA